MAGLLGAVGQLADGVQSLFPIGEEARGLVEGRHEGVCEPRLWTRSSQIGLTNLRKPCQRSVHEGVANGGMGTPPLHGDGLHDQRLLGGEELLHGFATDFAVPLAEGGERR
ncbi:hypothetical protein [Streptomyces panaciradicis]|uniref:hypothetical protein n=1 Tax=Streptomyces panaciradicis TaxID=1470261 RepID=UPI00201CE192|nr:hypothetical protein [Streptomyces panaciradicis]MCL6670859.1 hypothetical protein [Streptomyces panaciradicis]